MWSIHKYNAAVREAEEAGFMWGCEDTFSLIKQDGRNALKKVTWGEHRRVLWMGTVPDLALYREMLHRLRPTELGAFGCENVDALKGLTGLRDLSLYGCPALQNMDELKDLTGLQTLNLTAFPALQNLDALKGFTGLQTLFLSGCPALKNLDALKGLTNLHSLSLIECSDLQNVDGIKGLAGLLNLDIRGCYKIPAASLRELRAALTNTYITSPDGTHNPPQ